MVLSLFFGNVLMIKQFSGVLNLFDYMSTIFRWLLVLLFDPALLLIMASCNPTSTHSH